MPLFQSLTYPKSLAFCAGLLLAACALVYGYDLAFGNGDGLNTRLGINPLTWLLHGGIFLGLLRMMASSHKTLSNGATFIFTTILCLLLVDALLPKLLKNQAGVHQSLHLGPDGYPYTTLDSVYFKNYRPGVQFHTQLVPQDGPDSLIHHQINSIGMRGPEIAQKAAGKRRILLLGDSYIQALQVAYAQSIGPQLDILLPDSVEVIQHGIPSWSPLLEWNWLRHWATPLAIDEVVLFLYVNDFYGGKVVGDAGYTPYAKFSADGQVVGFDFSSLPNGSPSLWRNYQQWWHRRPLWRWAMMLYRRQQSKKELQQTRVAELYGMSPKEFAQNYQSYLQPEELLNVALWDLVAYTRDTSQWIPTTKSRFALSTQYLDGLHRYLSTLHIPLRIVYIPPAWNWADEGQAALSEVGWARQVIPAVGLPDALAAYCEGRAIPFLDLYPAFSRIKATNASEQPLYFPYDQHWTARGHASAAAVVAESFFSRAD